MKEMNSRIKVVGRMIGFPFNLYKKFIQKLSLILVSDRRYAEERFAKTFGRPLDLENPKTFNEKIQWIKLYYRRPMMTRLADKHLTREYVREKVGAQYLSTELGGETRPELP